MPINHMHHQHIWYSHTVATQSTRVPTGERRVYNNNNFNQAPSYGSSNLYARQQMQMQAPSSLHGHVNLRQSTEHQLQACSIVSASQAFCRRSRNHSTRINGNLYACGTSPGHNTHARSTPHPVVLSGTDGSMFYASTHAQLAQPHYNLITQDSQRMVQNPYVSINSQGEYNTPPKKAPVAHGASQDEGVPPSKKHHPESFSAMLELYHANPTPATTHRPHNLSPTIHKSGQDMPGSTSTSRQLFSERTEKKRLMKSGYI
jgi:hypothetical protein